jgi:hypothetical protein
MEPTNPRRCVANIDAYVAIPARYGDAFIASAAANGAISTEASKTTAIVSKPAHRVSRLYHHGGFDLFYVAAQ